MNASVEWDPEHIERSDGIYYDRATGEILELDTRLPERFVIDSESAADWAIERRVNLTSEIARLKAKRADIVARIDAEIARYERRVDGWDRRFLAPITEWAAAERERRGVRGKTLHTTHADLQQRETRPKHEITDMDGAVNWAELNAPDIVGVKYWVNVTSVLPYLDDGEQPSWLKVTPGGEKLVFKNGGDE